MKDHAFLASAKALADATRLRILAILMESELSVGEIVRALSLSQPRVSRHLKILADAGLVSSRRDGQCIYYALPEAGRQRDVLDAVAPFVGDGPDAQADVKAARQVIAERARMAEIFFERHADGWDAMREEALGGLDLAAEILRRMPEVSVAADLGCGTGRLMAALTERAGCVIGVDNSSRMLEKARTSFAESSDEVSFRIGDLAHLPVADGEVDFAVMSLALHHLPTPEKGVAEAYRALSRNSRFLLVEYGQHEDESMRKEAGDQWLGFSPERIAKWLDAAGFELLNTNRFVLPSGKVLYLYEAAKNHPGG